MKGAGYHQVPPHRHHTGRQLGVWSGNARSSVASEGKPGITVIRGDQTRSPKMRSTKPHRAAMTSCSVRSWKGRGP